MAKVKPIYLIALVGAIIVVAYLKISNPYREFSTSRFWQNATVQTVKDIPSKALKPGNRNGPVLMWAAIGGTDPEVLKALVARGALVNESDGVFKGTPLSGAAGYSTNPKMIDALIELGADIHQRVHNDETALMIAARYNQTPGITATLLKHGAKLEAKSKTGMNALDFAKANKNEVAVSELTKPEKNP